MNILALIFLLTITIPDSPAVLQDNQNSNGIIVNQDLSNDAQSNYNNGIQIVKDSVNQDTETTTTTQSTTTSSSSGGGGGGGGGIASSENFSNILKFEQHEGALIKDKLTSFKFNLSIYEILLTGKENEYDVLVRVELLRDKPQIATVTPDSEVIQYFNVITSTKRMKEVVIRFKSNQSTQLLKWDNSAWIALNTSFPPYIPTIPEAMQVADPDYIHYQVSTDSFSSFAIVKIPEIIPTLASAPQNTTIPIQVNTSLLSAQETPKQATGFTIILTIFVLLIVRRYKQ